MRYLDSWRIQEKSLMILYKYAPPERVDILENQRVRLTQPGDLNDPVEVQPRFSQSSVDWERFADDVADLFPALKSQEGNFKDFLHWLTPVRRRIVQQRILQMVWDLSTGVLSLSSSRRVEA